MGDLAAEFQKNLATQGGPSVRPAGRTQPQMSLDVRKAKNVLDKTAMNAASSFRGPASLKDEFQRNLGEIRSGQTQADDGVFGFIKDLPVIGLGAKALASKPVQGLFSIIDKPRALVAATGKELTDVAAEYLPSGDILAKAGLLGVGMGHNRDGSFDLGDLLENVGKNKGWGDYVEETNPDAPRVLKILAGLTGDIAVDPLTYVGGAGLVKSGGAEAARSITQSGARSAAKQIAEMGGGQLAEDITRAAAATADGLRASNVGRLDYLSKLPKRAGATELYRRSVEAGLESDKVAALVADYGRRGKAAITRSNLERLGIDPQVLDAVGGPKLTMTFAGQAVPGTRGASEAIVKGLDAVASRSGARRVAEAIVSRNAPNETVGAVNRLMSGVPTEAVRGAQQMLAVEAQRSGAAATDAMVRAMNRGIKPNLGATTNFAPIVDAVETGAKESGPLPQALRDWFANAHKLMTDEGVNVGERENYFPHMFTDEAKKLAEKDSAFRDKLTEVVVDPSNQTGIVKLRKAEGTIAEINREYVDKFGVPLFETDLRKVLPKYAEYVGAEVGLARRNKAIERLGLGRTTKKAEFSLDEEAMTAATAEAEKLRRRASRLAQDNVGILEALTNERSLLGQEVAAGGLQLRRDATERSVAAARKIADLDSVRSSLKLDLVADPIQDKLRSASDSLLDAEQKLAAEADKLRADAVAKAEWWRDTVVEEEAQFLANNPNALEQAFDRYKVALELEAEYSYSKDELKGIKAKRIKDVEEKLYDVEGRLLNLGGQPHGNAKGRIVFSLSPPPQAKAGGEWDWWFMLSPGERSRIARDYLRPYGDGSRRSLITKSRRAIAKSTFGRGVDDLAYSAELGGFIGNGDVEIYAEKFLDAIREHIKLRADLAREKSRTLAETASMASDGWEYNPEAAHFAKYRSGEWLDIFQRVEDIEAGKPRQPVDPASVTVDDDALYRPRMAVDEARARLAEAQQQANKADPIDPKAVKAALQQVKKERNAALARMRRADAASSISEQAAGERWLRQNPGVRAKIELIETALSSLERSPSPTVAASIASLGERVRILAPKLPTSESDSSGLKYLETSAPQNAPFDQATGGIVTDPKLSWLASREVDWDLAWAVYHRNAKEALSLESAARALREPKFQKKWVEVVEDGFKDLGNQFQGEAWLVDALSFTRQLKRDPNKMLKPLADAYMAVHRYFKSWAVGTPGFVLRNAYSAIWNNYALGEIGRRSYDEFMPLFRIYEKNPFDYMNKITEARGAAAAANFKQAIDAVAASGWGQGIHEGGRILLPKKRRFPQPWRTDNKFLEVIQKGNEFVETSVRGALAWDAVTRRGMDMSGAAALVNKVHFNYRDISEFDRLAKNVIPFWVFQSRNMPLQIASFFTAPRKMQQFNAVLRNVQLGEDEQVVPSFYGENMATPIGNLPGFGDGQEYFMPDLPFVALNNDLSRLADPVRALADANPIVKIAAEKLSGKNLFTDVPYTGLQEAPSWASAPGVQQILEGLNLVKIDSKGKPMMQDNMTSWIETLHPGLARFGRLAPAANELIPWGDPIPTISKMEDRAGSSVASFLGAGIRTNTENAQRGEILRRQRLLRELLDQQKQLGFVPRQ